jgi:hypothetical protein
VKSSKPNAENLKIPLFVYHGFQAAMEKPLQATADPVGIPLKAPVNCGWVWQPASNSHSAIELEQCLDDAVLVRFRERIEEREAEQTVADIFGDRAIARFAAVADGEEVISNQ